MFVMTQSRDLLVSLDNSAIRVEGKRLMLEKSGDCLSAFVLGSYESEEEARQELANMAAKLQVYRMPERGGQ